MKQGSQHQKQRASPEQRGASSPDDSCAPQTADWTGHSEEKVSGGGPDSGAQCLMHLDPSDVGEELEIRLVRSM